VYSGQAKTENSRTRKNINNGGKMGNQEHKIKMPFWEIGKGRFGREVQARFEQAQIDAAECNAIIKVVATIIVKPPETSDKRYGRVAYTTNTIAPPKKSMEYTTELVDGVIVADAEDMADLLQLKLDLEIPTQSNLVPMKEKTGNGN
jgi:hypothetical protein